MIALKILAVLVLSMIIPTIVGIENEVSNSPYKVKGLNPLLSGMVLGFGIQLIAVPLAGLIFLCVYALML